MKIPLPIKGYGPADFIAVVDAEIVDVAPHLPSATWAVHTRDAYDGQCIQQWTVSNIETGRGLGESHARSKSKAIAAARKFLLTKTDAETRKFLRKRAA